MGRVFGAELRGPDGFRKLVAVKVLKVTDDQKLEAKQQESLTLEARLGGLLQHPNIVDIYEFGRVDGQPYLAMEWLDGPSLSAAAKRWGPPPPSAFLEIAKGITAGLAKAHALNLPGYSRGLVHRDLKLSNILLSWDGSVKIADFGIATFQRKEDLRAQKPLGKSMGTPTYMSPEQARGLPVDGRSDLFSLGLLLYRLATGRPLYRAWEVLKSPITGKALQEAGDEVSAVVPGLGPIVTRCLRIEPNERYPSAESLYDALELLQERTAIHPSLRRWLRSRKATLSPRYVSSEETTLVRRPVSEDTLQPTEYDQEVPWRLPVEPHAGHRLGA